jgi:hypothetical protein
MSRLRECGNPAVPDPGALGRAHLAFGLIYLEEVQDHMTDYAEASGQAVPAPRISMTISGGTFHGGQFIANLASIDSMIAGVVHQGSSEMADALSALERAVLSERGIEDQQRRDLLDNIEYLAKAAQASPEKRNRGIIRSILTALKVAAISGGELSKALDGWEAVLHKLVC